MSSGHCPPAAVRRTRVSGPVWGRYSSEDKVAQERFISGVPLSLFNQEGIAQRIRSLKTGLSQVYPSLYSIRKVRFSYSVVPGVTNSTRRYGSGFVGHARHKLLIG
ncbi:hypothetical protein RRG08_020189 [Elysia crispata]|uniref:Uncharacterized protein n=1 Tax=Elysia crispata TaxID=231223 RepID=A0AAE1A1U6_9GAST|nr:hypothetical protein RRG08_020189 [Elysia crispata]